MTAVHSYEPLVSVVITTFNHARYIGQAIESVLAQTYTKHEIIVVDDGSTDGTESLVGKYKEVKYIFQENQGLPSARNTGIAHSGGEFLVFLDADDWLLPQALAANAAILQERSELAFVAGAHKFYIAKEDAYQPVIKRGGDNYYCRLLEGNFIGMHAVVMYRNWVFKEFLFDISLANCEDYDFYLQVVRKYPMHYHEEILSVYRIHDANMSGNARKMLDGALIVLQKHQPFTRDKQEQSCLESGILNFSTYYMEMLEKDFYLRLYFTNRAIGLDELIYLKGHSLPIFDRFLENNTEYLLKNPRQLAVTGWKSFLPRKLLLKSL